jgi:hypothetical protein
VERTGIAPVLSATRSDRPAGTRWPHGGCAAIANQNTLIYLLINLRFLQRLRNGQHEDA